MKEVQKQNSNVSKRNQEVIVPNHKADCAICAYPYLKQDTCDWPANPCKHDRGIASYGDDHQCKGCYFFRSPWACIGNDQDRKICNGKPIRRSENNIPNTDENTPLLPEKSQKLLEFNTMGADLDESFTDEELDASYRKLAKAYHPDHFGDDKQFKKMKKIYEELKA